MSSPIAGSTPIADLVRAYLAAEYRWQHNSDWHDLRIGLQVPALELLYPDSGNFGLLSAWNPHSIEHAELANREADRALHQDLVDTGAPFLAAFASAPNRSWREPSWVVMDLPVERFDALSRKYGQLGTLWWTRGRPGRLRVDAVRPAGLDDDEHVDWLQSDALAT
ncbi:MAG: DUF3293 domain-containing protein [Luteimonas sp.]|nr:DUF3293 domain-containing protein [Luteimonas sp.]